MTILSREQMLATIPALFTGDERQVLEDWVKLAPTFEIPPQHQALNEELLASEDPVQRMAGYLMKHHATKLVFDAINEARADGISHDAVVLGILSWAFGSIHSYMKSARIDPGKRLDLSIKLAEESSENVARLVIMGF